MGHNGELSLTPQDVEVISDLCCVELPSIVEYHCSRNAKASDDIFSNKISDLDCNNIGNSLSLYPLCEVVHHDKEVLALTHVLGEGFKCVHAPSCKW